MTFDDYAATINARVVTDPFGCRALYRSESLADGRILYAAIELGDHEPDPRFWDFLAESLNREFRKQREVHA